MARPRIETPGYRTQSPDTDEWAERLQFEHWRSLETWEKARLVSDRLHLLGLRERVASHSWSRRRGAIVALAATRVLERLGIPYLVGGSVASTLYGEPRTTMDVDLAVQLAPAQVALLDRALAEGGRAG